MVSKEVARSHLPARMHTSGYKKRHRSSNNNNSYNNNNKKKKTPNKCFHLLAFSFQFLYDVIRTIGQVVHVSLNLYTERLALFLSWNYCALLHYRFP